VIHARLTATLAASIATHTALLFTAATLLPRASLLPPLMVDLAAGAPAPEPAAAPVTARVAPAPRTLASHRESTVAGRSPGSRADAAPAARTSEPLAAVPETPPRSEVAPALPSLSAAPVQITAPSAPAATQPVPPPSPSAELAPPAEQLATPAPEATTPSARAAGPPPVDAATATAPSAALGVAPGDGRTAVATDARPGAAASIGGAGSGGAHAAATARGSGGQGLSAAVAPGDGGIAGDGGREYAGYLSLIRTKIQQALQYPPAARRRSLSGTVHLEILIEPSGAIERASIVGASAHPVLDEAVLATVRSLPPVPFPPSLRPRPLRARLPIVFELQ